MLSSIDHECVAVIRIHINNKCVGVGMWISFEVCRSHSVACIGDKAPGATGTDSEGCETEVPEYLTASLTAGERVPVSESDWVV